MFIGLILECPECGLLAGPEKVLAKNGTIIPPTKPCPNCSAQTRWRSAGWVRTPNEAWNRIARWKEE